jgi:translocation-and-assembly-module (TAM) inner membrane subunit TamB-like protein
MRRSIRLVARLLRWFVYAVLISLVLVVLALVVLQTGWAKNQIRALIVRQANQYLTATLSIGRLQGSLVRGIELGDITLARNGQTIISIDAVALSYSIRELFTEGTSIREIRVARPYVIAAKEADGRWNLGALIKRTTQVSERRGPGRPIHIRSIKVTDGTISLRDPISFGAVHIPSEYKGLNLDFSLDYRPVAWKASFANASFSGTAPDLQINRLAGSISDNADGWLFDHLLVETPRSHFILDGRVDRRTPPVRLPLKVDAERFAFQEWSGILNGLKNIAIESQFNVQLDGPLDALKTDLTLRSNGGHVKGAFTLDTKAPGWKANGAVDVERLNLADWLNREDRPSDITGHVTFGLTDVGLRAGGHFPVGTYAFDGAHAAYLSYAADNLKAHGVLTPTDARIASATAKAYGADVTVSDGSIGIDSPNRFAFKGSARGVDLRQVPKEVPVPHVESVLAFDYDVSGQFSSVGFIKGTAGFGDSTFLEARVGAGTVGFVDTSVTPFLYSGEGDLSRIDLNRFGRDLDVGWLKDPRYAGTVAGHFHVTGAGSDVNTMTLTGGGHISRADLFGGQLTDADVTLDIRAGSLSGSYDGRIANVNPKLALDDDRFDASLTGSGTSTIAVKDLLLRSPQLADYEISSQVMLGASRVRTVQVESADFSATLHDGTLTVDRFHGVGPSIDLEASGRVELDGTRSSELDYTIVHGDLALVRDLIGREVSGEIVSKGQLTGPLGRIHLHGTGTLAHAEGAGLKALSGDLNYDATIPSDAPENAAGTIDGHINAIEAFGEQIAEASGKASYDAGRITTDVQLQRDNLQGTVVGMFQLHTAEKRLDLLDLTLGVQRSTWKLVTEGTQPYLLWNDRGLGVSYLALVDQAATGQRLEFNGTWYPEGGGDLHVRADRVSLDALFSKEGEPALYGGTADIDAFLRGTRERPIVSGRLTVTDGRVWRVSYQQLAGRVDYADGAFQVDLRLDQRPGVWLTAVGSAPLGLFYPDMPERSVDIKLISSTVDLGLLEGLTTVVSNVGGTINLDVDVVGTTKDPHFDGRVDVANASFLVVDSGSKYRNGRLAAQLSTDRVTVETLHLEDSAGHPLDVQGSLGTHELRVGDLAIHGVARQFEVLRNEYGRLAVDATVDLNGQFEMPRLSGRITISGGELNVDRILDRTLLQPYSTQAAPPPEADAIASLNPWNRLGLDLELKVPNTLRLIGDNIQISPGTPLGLGNFNLRALGDLYLYKDPADQLYVTGSLDQVTGRYTFQGRRFDLNPTSSINFRGDLNPDLFVVVTRDISGVEARVTISGPLNAPELHLASTPPLDQSDILSLIVFNTSTNQLSTLQQQQLAVRAGTLAAGFVAAPLMSALERTLGIETFEIVPTTDIRGGTGARVTIGSEIAPGLVARFSRNFGVVDYNEAQIEYYLSRLFRIRATFTDAASTTALSPFVFIQRAGVDLLMVFSF